MIILQILILVFLSFVLIKSADQVIIAVHRLSKNSKSIAFLISAIFLAIATSLPELFVGINSGLDGLSSLSFGNIIGANIANITLVAGFATLIVGKVEIHQKFVNKEVFIAILAGVLPFVLVFIDGNLSRIDGIILICAYLLYVFSFFKERLAHITEDLRDENFFHKLFRGVSHIDGKKSKEVLRLILGVVFLLISSNMLVEVAEELSISIGISVFIVGLIILSIGTTLPELAFSINALKENEPTMFYGNLLGSIIVNSTLIIGIAATISPINNFILSKYTIALIVFTITYILFALFTLSKKRLDRWEGGVLVLIYLVFLVLEFIY